MRRLMRVVAIGRGFGLPLMCAAAASPPAAAPVDLAASVDPSGPGQLVQTAASAMLKDLDAHRSDYPANPGKVHEPRGQVLLPPFGPEYSARLVLGKYWTTASETQRQRFIKAFYKSLL